MPPPVLWLMRLRQRWFGWEWAVREWAIRQGWGGRPVRHEQAQGILVAALGVLAVTGRHPARRAS
jgi:hypothetical protein